MHACLSKDINLMYAFSQNFVLSNCTICKFFAAVKGKGYYNLKQISSFLDQRNV